MSEHNSAVTKEQAALHEAKAKEEHHQRAQAILAEKKAALDNLQNNVSDIRVYATIADATAQDQRVYPRAEAQRA